MPPGAPSPDRAHIGADLKPRPQTWVTDIEDPEMVSRVAVLAAEAADATRKMVDETAAITTRVERTMEVFKPSTKRGQRRVVALWADDPGAPQEMPPYWPPGAQQVAHAGATKVRGFQRIP